MNKQLYTFTKDDWNTLFPVELVEHDASWAALFSTERESIRQAIGPDTALRIEHFGSTAIPGIKAKPYIDLLVEIPSEMLFSEEIINRLGEIGYTYFLVPERDAIPAYMSFGKGYNLSGEKEQIYHIHMCPKENGMWQQIDFRNYLIAHPERARAYEQLKTEAAARFRNDRGAYVLSKNDFIRDTLALVPKASGQV